MNATIRTARPADVGGLTELMLEFRDTEWPDISPNEDKIAEFMGRVIRDGIVFLAEDGGRIVGSLGIKPTQWWFSDDHFLMEHWFYVARSHRRSTIAPRLLRKAKEFQKRAVAPMVVGLFARRDVARKTKLFRRHFQPVGETYIVGMVDLKE